MPPPRNWTDDELHKIVFDYRALKGACTLDDICRATGMSKTAVAYRVRKLIEAGRLMRSGTAGSIRGTDERMMRELPDGRLVEVKVRARHRRGGRSY